MQRYLLDTNAIIYLIGGRLATPLPAGHYSFSVISEIELLSFSGLSAEDEQKIGELLALLDKGLLKMRSALLKLHPKEAKIPPCA